MCDHLGRVMTFALLAWISDVNLMPFCGKLSAIKLVRVATPFVCGINTYRERLAGIGVLFQ